MNDQQRFSISELEEQTGQQRRTIHHYISRGLLPKAEGSGPRAFYTREHYLRLRLIGLLVEAGVGTDLIQSSLDGWSPEDMERLVSMAEGQRLDDLDKLSLWLNRSELPLQGLDAELMMDAAPEVHELHSPARGIAADLADWAREGASTSDPPAAQRPSQRNMRSGISSDAKRMSSGLSKTPSARLPRPDRWERIRIGDDLEITYRSKGNRLAGKKIHQLKEVLRSLFAEEIEADATKRDNEKDDF